MKVINICRELDEEKYNSFVCNITYKEVYIVFTNLLEYERDKDEENYITLRTKKNISFA